MTENGWPVILAGATALVYTTGYSYLNAYYGHFGVEVGELELSVQDVLANAFSVYIYALHRMWAFLMGGILGLFATAALGLAIAYTIRRLTKVKGWLIPAGIGLLFAGLFVAQSAGRSNAVSDTRRLNTASLVDPEDKAGINEIRKADGGAAVLHLATSKTSYFLIVRLTGGHTRWVVRVPKSNVQVLHVFQQY